ncbi:MAG: hypothetical protein KIS78_13095 [Labilithrix sp.]|nr:hypothetical protein [Labilithrix sp.]MCW5833331.1 hypothetical protein [Labilithrix sp.]
MIRRALILAGATPLLLLAAGCPEDAPRSPDDGGADAPPTSVCPTGYLGDPSADAVVELRALRADGTDVPLSDGDDLAVLFPPQGGRVAFVGVRALNVDGCGVQIVGALRDPGSKQLRLDGRTVNLRREPDGWGTTGRGTTTNIEDSAEIGDYSNIPLCPNQWADQDVFDVSFELEVVVTDRRKKTTTKKIAVVPRCAEPGDKETACRCLCRNGYVLGETCGEDAGVDGATP